MNPIVESLLLRSAISFLVVGGLAGVLVGVLLLWCPHRLRKIGDVLNRWISTRRMDRPLERTVTLDPWFYRHRRASGLLILFASAYIVYFFVASLDKASAVVELSARFALPSGLVGGLLDALVLSALLGALLAALVGLFLLLRPSLLREFEQGANQWVSLRRALKPLELPRSGVDEYVFKYGRQAGILLILGGIYTLVLLTFWLGYYS